MTQDQIITAFAAALAGAIVWIVKDFRRESVGSTRRMVEYMSHSITAADKRHDEMQAAEREFKTSFLAHIDRFSSAVEANTAAMVPMMETLQQMSNAVSEMSQSVRQLVESNNKDLETLLSDYTKHGRR